MSPGIAHALLLYHKVSKLTHSNLQLNPLTHEYFADKMVQLSMYTKQAETAEGLLCKTVWRAA